MTLSQSPLARRHAQLGSQSTDFGGWEMPLRYGSELAEHRAVREAAGLFDLSHMGEVAVEGAGAAEALNRSLVGDFAALKVGRAKYSLMLSAGGGIIDDLIVYRLSEDFFLVVPNAGNASVVAKELEIRAAGTGAVVEDKTTETALIAVQGPRAAEIVAASANGSAPVEDLSYYSVSPAVIAGVEALVARTGYTGEDGFELFVPWQDAETVWDAVLEVGSEQGLIPCGLAARDSLRLEAGMALYGNELSLDVSPAAAGLAGIVSFKKAEDFVGREATERADEPACRLVGLQGTGRRAARAGYRVYRGDECIGEVTSGALSPTLGYPIALAYVDREASAPGTALEVDVRGKPQSYEVVRLPFYRRSKEAN